MIILGISDSIESHACIVKNGELLAAISEERLTRLKSDSGYPKKSIKKVLEISNIKANEIDIVALAGFDNGLFQTIYKPNALFSVQDWIKQNEKFWKPVLFENKKLNEMDDFKLFKNNIPNLKRDPYYNFYNEAKMKSPKLWIKIFNKVRKRIISNQLGIDEKKIHTFRHETCHQYYGHFSQQQFKNNTLILTLEGRGDDSSATISIAKNGKIFEKYRTNNAMIGRIYRYTTLLLGMKPGQHEYKVMGLAPYGQKFHGDKSLNHFRKFNKINGYKIFRTKKFKDCYYSSRENLHGERFDGIAWGLQSYTEEFMFKWTINCINKFKISNVVYSGGVAQNIKALKYLNDQKKIKSVWSGPITGDGSLAIGAAWIASKKFNKKNKIQGLSNIYLGSTILKSEAVKAIKKKCKNFKIIKNVNNKQIAKWLSIGLIIGRCKGRMEFGQRALGNRSILADPRNQSSVDKINSKIKYRDFWMPFTPSMTYEGAKKILKNPKKIYSPFMTMAFDLKEKFIEKIPGVIHPADKSTRPQMLKKKDNPDYYNLIKEFEKISGLPVVLNTSLNLHGDAMVENPNQAIDTFLKSDLDILILEKFAIIRRLKKNV